ncbi:autophagocytosis associated protein [Gautieria morchelliformis]|nr:autophagocytosis associated protein [Gautieria morchelliformis]
MHAIQQQFWAVREYLSPVLKESKFKEHGRITPEEFVAAGDFLTYKFPVWSWEKGEPSKSRDYLPADKQYLVTHGVSCLRRATSLAYTDADEDAERLISFADSGSKDNDDEWVETHAGRASVDPAANPGDIEDIPDFDGPSSISNNLDSLNISGDGPSKVDGDVSADIPDMDDIPDMEEEGLEGVDDEATARPAAASAAEVEIAKGNLLQVRTYDVMITYDKYYQTPRVWLLGYDENGIPLTTPQIFQDVAADHALKTVTIEPFPHSNMQTASVHPCKHASVMKKVIERMNAGVVEEQQRSARSSGGKEGGKRKWLLRKVPGSGGEDGKKAVAVPDGVAEGEEIEGMRVDFYLVVFLKFIASIIPTIEVDSTTAF